MSTPAFRSTLHALSPIGLGTAAVESLTSYFCRLAHSHSLTATQLAAWVLQRFGEGVPANLKWYQRNFASLSARSEQWASWLAELTGVGDLDRLTLVPWRHLVAGPGFVHRTDHWCPQCLAEDRASGAEPYLRLAWDVAPVAACAKHKVRLASNCPHCGRGNVRNRASVVVPGYCTACGGFLGDAPTDPAVPEALWAARQVGLMLAMVPAVGEGGAGDLLRQVIDKLVGGNAATFARQLGLSKAGVCHWLVKGGLPGIRPWLATSLHGGIGMDRLFQGNLDDWEPPNGPRQLPIPSLESPRKGVRVRVLDWDAIRVQLRAIAEEPEPVTLAEACERVGVAYKHLYLRANTEARQIANRFRERRDAIRNDRQQRLQAEVSTLLRRRVESGCEGMSARDLRQAVPAELLGLRHSYTVIRQATWKPRDGAVPPSGSDF